MTKFHDPEVVQADAVGFVKLLHVMGGPLHMGVLHLDLVRVANNHRQEEMSLDNMAILELSPHSPHCHGPNISWL